ncbi:MAG: beta-galactosidase, partial [Tannerellaceae bacterium]|nr:beta-galactosidase [Tannerellaceae bacterium]
MKNMPALTLMVLISLLYLFSGCNTNKQNTFEIGKNTFLLHGKPFVIKAAEIHYTRIPSAYREHRMQHCKALG